MTGKHVPIIAMTAHAMKGDRERCLEAGMDGYIAKPIRSAELFEAVEKAAGAGRAGERVPRLSTAVAPSVERPPAGACDWEVGLVRAGGDRRLLQEIAGLMLEECARLLADLRSALQSGSASKVRLAAHTLKGTLDNVAAHAARSVAEHLETMGRNGDLAGADEAYRALEKEVERLLPELRAFANSAQVVAT